MSAATPGAPMLEVRALGVRYGDLVGISDVSLEVRPGEVVALLGSNGAGKTTTLNAIAGLVPPSSGAVLWQGAAIGGLPPHAIVARGIALSPEGWRLFSGQTVEQNLRLGATPLGGDRARRIPDLLERAFTLFPRLKERRRQSAGTLSGGERQMLALGRALMSEPRLLMLDEPSLGLAPRMVDELLGMARRIADSGTTVLMVEQNVKKALAVADRGYVLERGTLVASGPARLLERSNVVREAYLGADAVERRRKTTTV
jgi:branched-chain amino acid transport system ATP-binding protein